LERNRHEKTQEELARLRKLECKICYLQPDRWVTLVCGHMACMKMQSYLVSWRTEINRSSQSHDIYYEASAVSETAETQHICGLVRTTCSTANSRARSRQQLSGFAPAIAEGVRRGSEVAAFAGITVLPSVTNCNGMFNIPLEY
jgi:hypothetical protein